MRKYDVIVIGGGVAGVGVGALLAKAGYKALLLEKEPRLGGRSATFEYLGYQVDVGTHQIASYSSAGIKDIVEEVGAEIELVPIKPSMMHFDLDTRKYLRATSPERLGESAYFAFRSAFGTIAAMERDEINKYHDMSAQEWIEKNFPSPEVLEFFKKITGFGGAPLYNVSAGAFLETLSDSARSQITITYTKGGIGRLSDALGEAMIRHGGEIQKDVTVRRVIVEDGAVKGVAISVVRPSYIAEDEIEAPVVVNTIPITRLFSLIDKEQLDPAVVNSITEMQGERYLYGGVIAGVKASLFDGFSTQQFFQWTADRPGMGWHALMTVPSWADPSLAPPGYHLLMVDVHVPVPISSRHLIKDYQGYCMDILHEIWPNFDDYVDWLHRVEYNELALPVTKGKTGPHRPGPVVHGVEGLYQAGAEAYRSGSGIGSAMKSVLLCVAKVKEDHPMALAR